MNISFITQTHNRRTIFLQNLKKNLNKIKKFRNKIKINWVFNCDDGSVTEKDIRNIFDDFFDKKELDFINIYFFEYKYFFPKRYFNLMIKIKSDLVWCIEDDDYILDIDFLLTNKINNYFGYYLSSSKKINDYNLYFFKNKKINYVTLQLSQLIMKYNHLQHFIKFNKKEILNKDYINHDELLINWFLKYKNVKIIQKNLFFQNINKDNMSYKDLKEWL